MSVIADLPLEIVVRILTILDPLDVASVSQVSHFFYDIVYGPHHHQFWRGLYLAQSLDDPRHVVDRLGFRRIETDWKNELQRIIRARTVVLNLDVCTSQERCMALKTLLHLVSNVPPLPSLDCDDVSHNIAWVQHLLDDGAVLEPDWWAVEEEEEEEEAQLRARLHTWFGLIPGDAEVGRRQASQAFVYSRRQHTQARHYGPFMPTETKRVDWVFMQALAHVVELAVIEHDGDKPMQCTLGLPFCQSVIPRGIDLDNEDDWAGVEGLWRIGYTFLDHRELIIYNNPMMPEDEPQDTSIFDGIEETWSYNEIYLRLTNVVYDPAHPTRPQIHYVGELPRNFVLSGTVKLIDDDQVWWHFDAGNGNQAAWSCEGIGLGNVRSQCGVVGVWATVFHDADDPLGPFWMQRQPIEDD